MHLRHEHLSLQMLLATFQHHSAPKGQTTARSRWRSTRRSTRPSSGRTPPSQASGTQYTALDVDEVPVAGGSRPDRLLNVSGPQERVLRRTVEQLIDSALVVPLLDVLVPQTVDWLEDVLKIVDISVPQQVIEVPMISCPVQHTRAVLAATLMVEQSVEVPWGGTDEFFPCRRSCLSSVRRGR